MKQTEKIDELLKSKERKKINIDIKDDNQYGDITKKLEEERVVKFDDFTHGDMKVINIKEDLKEFDYFNDVEMTETVSDKMTQDIYDQTGETISITSKIEEEIDESVEDIKMVDQQEVDDSNNDKFDGLDVSSSINDVPLVEALKLEKKPVMASTDKPIISYRDVHFKIDRDEIIRGVTLDIYPGEFVYFVGKSGAGKSSLAKMIYREAKNTGGEIIVNDVNITKMKNRKLPMLRRNVGVIFQDFKLLSDKTIYENVRYSLDVTNYPKKLKHDQVLKTLKVVGILEQKDKYPNELSGGQQQRVAIARAIVDDPKIIVADEPTGNLDPQNALAIMEILSRINSTGTTIVMATHDVGIVNKYQNRVILFEKGLIVNESDGGYIYE